ncbi:hypothetical protein [Anaerobacterium chartisolvens]|uniref:hypothetical protein n=1 Tax=Anaerobacterium chartisolvens TaxID=1297424 RepID=UPI001A9A3749|nr:hypothetical protein [Anaerobacterium chartisolvens]
MQNKLKEYMSTNCISFTTVLKELRKIKYVVTRDGRKFLSPVTKKQRDILSECSVSADDLTSWFAAIPV